MAKHSLSDAEEKRIREQIEAEDRELAEKARKADQNILMSKVFSQSMVNKKLENACFDNYEPETEEAKRALIICKKYASNFKVSNPQSIMLYGTFGIGKSHLAVAIMRELSKIDLVMKWDESRNVVLKTRKMSMLFINTAKLLTKIRSSFNADSEFSEDKILQELEDVDLLVLDDFGSEIKDVKPADFNTKNGFAIEKIFEIVESRVGKHTIFTTNYDVDTLFRYYGERSFSRAMEDTTLIQMTGRNYRLRGFEK